MASFEAFADRGILIMCVAVPAGIFVPAGPVEPLPGPDDACSPLHRLMHDTRSFDPGDNQHDQDQGSQGRKVLLCPHPFRGP